MSRKNFDVYSEYVSEHLENAKFDIDNDRYDIKLLKDLYSREAPFESFEIVEMPTRYSNGLLEEQEEVVDEKYKTSKPQTFYFAIDTKNKRLISLGNYFGIYEKMGSLPTTNDTEIFNNTIYDLNTKERFCLDERNDSDIQYKKHTGNTKENLKLLDTLQTLFNRCTQIKFMEEQIGIVKPELPKVISAKKKAPCI